MIFVNIYEYFWIFVNICVICDIFDICEYLLWIFMNICEYLWIFMNLREYFVNIYEYLWIFDNVAEFDMDIDWGD